jgi:hypothetical protein
VSAYEDQKHRHELGLVRLLQSTVEQLAPEEGSWNAFLGGEGVSACARRRIRQALAQLWPEQTGKSQLFVADEYAKMPMAAAAT